VNRLDGLTKTFYSYYNAFYLNKIKFVAKPHTNPELKYLISKNIINPLTNTPVVGLIQYYWVRPHGHHPLALNSADEIPTNQEMHTTITIERNSTLKNNNEMTSRESKSEKRNIASGPLLDLNRGLDALDTNLVRAATLPTLSDVYDPDNALKRPQKSKSSQKMVTSTKSTEKSMYYSISFANYKSQSTQRVSLSAWIEDLKVRRASKNSMAPTTSSKNKSDTLARHENNRLSTAIEEAEGNSDQCESTFDAIYMGTEWDYCRDANVLRNFRFNARTPSEACLWELPAQEPSEESSVDVFGFSESDVMRMNNIARIAYRIKYWIALLVLIVIISAVLVVIYSPS
jgi:hypothetical protein